MIIIRSGTGLLVAGLIISGSLHAQIPRTPTGQPDLQGTWFYGSATPFERPEELGLKRAYTRDEALGKTLSILEDYKEKSAPSDPNRDAPERGATIGREADDNFRTIRSDPNLIKGEYRTSLIIDPPNGQLPYRVGGKDIYDHWKDEGAGEFDGPEIRSAGERCLSSAGHLPPMYPSITNANIQIIQTPEFIVIYGERNGARIIPVNGEFSAHGFNRWMGESVGRWDGDTFVIRTINLDPRHSWRRTKSTDGLELIEYFNIVSEDEILYRYVVTDPEIYTTSWTVETNLARRAAGEHLYEFACHEANYSLPAILRGARFSESEAQENQ